MNTRFTVATAFVILPLSHTFAQFGQFGPSEQKPPLISVSGSAEVKVAPDEIYLRCGVETKSNNLDEAKRQNDERMSKALDFLKKSRIDEKNVKTDFISIEPDYHYPNNKITPPELGTYTVRKSLEIKLTQIDAFDGIVTGLLTAGVTNVHGIEFRTSQLRKHRDAARALAIRAAKEKAIALGAELGVQPGKVFNISATDYGGWWSGSSGSYWWGGRSGGSPSQNVSQDAGRSSETTDGTLSIGQVSVSASVNVSFLIEE